jgi:flagellar assembly protein FliH
MAGQALKFLFDRSFDYDADGRGPAAAEAVEPDVAAEPEPPPPPPPPTFSEADLEAARAASFAEGSAAGAREAISALEQQLAAAMAATADGLQSLAAQHAADTESAHHDGIAVAVSVVRKLFPALSEAHGVGEVEHVVRDVLEQMTSEPVVRVRTAPALADAVRERLATAQAEIGFQGRIEVETDAAVAAGDCRVAWSRGGAERSAAMMWNAIDEIIERNLGPAPQGSLMAVDGQDAPARPDGA